MDTVAEAGELAGAPAPARKIFPTPSLYKIIKILQFFKIFNVIKIFIL
jgi:hypothetical protein